MDARSERQIRPAGQYCACIPKRRSLAPELGNALTRQFTRCGPVCREFDGYDDGRHHGESHVSFCFFGRAHPTGRAWWRRALRFAELDLNEVTFWR